METHDYQQFLAINDIDHSKTKAQSPQTNGICERFHKTILQEFYQVTYRKKRYGNLDELQQDLDEWLEYYNNERTHQGKMCSGRLINKAMGCLTALCICCCILNNPETGLLWKPREHCCQIAA